MLLLTAAFFGGGLNAIAGGGSFFTLPALVYAGLPPVTANATGTVALLPGYLASTWGFREDLKTYLAQPGALPIGLLSMVSLAGGTLGALLLLATPDRTFRSIIPWLLLLATLLFAVGPWLLRQLKPNSGAASAKIQALSVFLVCIYGGYFNGGLGIILLAAFSLLGYVNLNSMNALKNAVSALLTSIAVAVYAVGGAVAWKQAAGMMLAAMMGGYVAARVARRLPAVFVRLFVIAVGLTMTVLFFLR